MSAELYKENVRVSLQLSESKSNRNAAGKEAKCIEYDASDK